MAQPTDAKDPAPARTTAAATTDQDAACVLHHSPWSSGRLVTPNPHEDLVRRAYISSINLVILLSL